MPPPSQNQNPSEDRPAQPAPTKARLVGTAAASPTPYPRGISPKDGRNPDRAGSIQNCKQAGQQSWATR